MKRLRANLSMSLPVPSSWSAADVFTGLTALAAASIWFFLGPYLAAGAPLVRHDEY